MPVRNCPCGSGHPRHALYDARNIFVTFVCVSCEERKRQTYRAEIFDNPSYETDEPIEPED